MDSLNPFSLRILGHLTPKLKRLQRTCSLPSLFWLTYEIDIQKAIPELLHTFGHRETLPGQILGIIGSTYDDGEPYVQNLLAYITEEHVWKQLVGVDDNGNPNVLCPLRYSKQDMAKFNTEYAKWEKGR